MNNFYMSKEIPLRIEDGEFIRYKNYIVGNVLDDFTVEIDFSKDMLGLGDFIPEKEMQEIIAMKNKIIQCLQQNEYTVFDETFNEPA